MYMHAATVHNDVCVTQTFCPVTSSRMMCGLCREMQQMTQTKDASLLSSHSYTSMVSSCMQHGASFSQLEHSLDVTTDGRGRAGLYYMSYVRYVLLMRQKSGMEY